MPTSYPRAKHHVTTKAPIVTNGDRGVDGSGRLVSPDDQLTGDVVPRILLEEKQQEALAKDETIQILNAKIRRLEHLIQIKDIRIEDLQTRLHHMEMAATATASSKNNSSSPNHRPQPIRSQVVARK
jgi:hypothetical protein